MDEVKDESEYPEYELSRTLVLKAVASVDEADVTTKVYCEACRQEIPSESKMSEKGLLTVFTHVCSCGEGTSVQIVREPR